ncbi:MAG: tripartite tricarboxylate transporter TctB family protein [Paracoccaceae bacterium]
MTFPSLRLIVAVILAGIGLIGFVIGLNYDFGSARRMGPGYFPVVLSGLLFVLAMAEGLSALLQPQVPDTEPLDWRSLIAILCAVAGFAITIAVFGLLPAFAVVVGLSTMSERGYGWKLALILAVVTCIGAWLLFTQLLGMALPLVQWRL